MKAIINGSRDMTDQSTLELIETAVKESGFKITKLLSSEEKGVEMWARNWANANDVPIEEYKADWKNIKGIPKEHIKVSTFNKKKYNSMAGKQRDERRVALADCVIIIDDGGFNIGYLAKQYDVPTYIYKLNEDDKEYEYDF